MSCNAFGTSKRKFAKVAGDDIAPFNKPKGNHQEIASALRTVTYTDVSWPGFPFPAGLFVALLTEKGAKEIPIDLLMAAKGFCPCGPGA